MHSPFINTALYTLINSRLVKGKKMVIITVLTEDVELPAVILLRSSRG